MKRDVGILASTHIDTHGDLFTLEALEKAAIQSEQQFLPVNFNHDPRIPPLGRMVKAEVVQLPDGEHGLVAHSEIFEPGDVITPLPGRERPLHQVETGTIEVVFDRSYRSELDTSTLEEIQGLPGVSTSCLEKKALEPLSVLTVAFGLWAAASYFSGFLNQMGADTWDFLKTRIKTLQKRRREEGREYLFILEAQIPRDSGLLCVKFIATSPAAGELDLLLSSGLAELDKLIAKMLSIDPDVREIVFNLNAPTGHLEAFAIRYDCAWAPLLKKSAPTESSAASGSRPATLRPEQQRALDYLRRKGTEAPVERLREHVAGTFAELEALLDGVPPALRTSRPGPGRWSVQEVVDHLVESHRPALAQLRSLVAGERPAGGPVPASLQSAAPHAHPWEDLVAELREVHRGFREVLADAGEDVSLEVTGPIVMVVKVADGAGAVTPVSSEHELDWKAFAQVFRVHTVQHRDQIRATLSALGQSTA